MSNTDPAYNSRNTKQRCGAYGEVDLQIDLT